MTEIQRIHIVHTNDLHSRFHNMAKIATYIKELKKEAVVNGERVLAADLGDHLDRVQMETEGTKGMINIELLNRSGVDVATIGNNEGITFTKEELKRIYSQKSFKLLACNLKEIETNSSPSWLEDYYIQEVNGLRIGWVGVTAPYKIFYKLQGWQVEAPLEPLRRIVQELKSQVDILILLSHLGFRGDEKIAEALPEIDVILGGHTHLFFEVGAKKADQALICQVGIYGEYLGHLTIDYDIESKRIESLKEKTISLADYAADPELLEIIERNRLIANKELSTPITYLQEPLDISLDSESALGNLLADGVKKWVKADIGLVNAGQILAGLGTGLVTKKMLHQICPSPINTCKLKLSGQQIKTVLEQSLLDEYKYLQLQGYGFRGKELGTLSVSGITIEYDLLLPKYQKIQRILFAGSLLEPQQEYLVGTLDMFTFGGGYGLIGEGREIEYFVPEFIRDILAFFLPDSRFIEEGLVTRWVR